MHKETAFESLGSIWSPCFRRTLHTELPPSFPPPPTLHPTFISFPVKARRGAYPFCFLTTSSLKFLAHYTAPAYQKQDAFLYCQPFHLKCKLILTQCALTKIKVGTLTFPGRAPSPSSSSSSPPPHSHWRTREGAKRGRREEGKGGGDLALLLPALLRAALSRHMEHLGRLRASCKCPPLKKKLTKKTLVNKAAEWVNTVVV